MEFLVGSVWAAGLAIGIAAFGCGIGQIGRASCRERV